MKRVIFLDRDGVINKKAPEHKHITRLKDFIYLPGVVEAVNKLAEMGYILVIISN